MVRPSHVTPGIYRPYAGEWQSVEILAVYPTTGKYLCREVGRVFPGVFLALRYDLRVDASVHAMVP